MAARKRQARAGKATGRAHEMPARPAITDPRQVEGKLAAVTRLLEAQNFETVEEADAFLQNLVAASGGMVPDLPPQTPLDEAQNLVYKALDAKGRRRMDLARKALEVSPDCADAYVLLAEGTKDPQEARALYEQGVAAGERALGPETFKREKGNFWGILETRPYMRARAGLAQVLWHLGERGEAIDHLREMLRLNPNDNQGMRYDLANWLLAVGDDAALRPLLTKYRDDASASWVYTRALSLFRRYGAGKRADRALLDALAANPFVPFYLLAIKKMPRRLPAYVGIGDEDEAVSYVAATAQTWLDIPGALEWFMEVLASTIPPELLDFPPDAPPNLFRL